jgi:hypothetical protein
MPSPISINIRCEPYLICFMESLFGSQPILLPRKDNFALLLNYLLVKAPDYYVNTRHGYGTLQLQLPYFEDKNVLYHFYLSPVKEIIFIRKIEELFRVSFRTEMNQCILLGIKRIDAIHLFMDTYNLPESSIDMLLKDYQRYRNGVRQKIFTENLKISSVKPRFCPVPVS